MMRNHLLSGVATPYFRITHITSRRIAASHCRPLQLKRLQGALHVLRTRELADHEVRHVARERFIYPGKDKS